MNTPSVGDVVADNLRTGRSHRHLSAKAVEEALDKLGVAMSRSSVAKSEHIDPQRRHAVDVDELVALALVLETSPTSLMTPANDVHRVAVTPETSVDADVFANWLTGDHPLWKSPEPVPNRLPAGAGEQLADLYDHPSLEAAGVLGSVMASALMNRLRDRMVVGDDEEAIEAARERRKAEAAEIRLYAARAAQYAQLLADELEGPDRPRFTFGGGAV